MQELALQLMAQARGLSTETKAGDRIVSQSPILSADTYRIGLWPLVSETEPEVALGLMSVLGLLLENWQDAIVYRLFVRTDTDGDWSILDSQFDVDDWQLDGLDENVAIWGRLNRIGGDWTLELHVEIDNANGDSDDAIPPLTYSSAGIAGLVEKLPSVAGEIASLMQLRERRRIAPIYSAESWDQERLMALLREVFDWEKELFLALWVDDWTGDDVVSDAEALISAGQALGGSFAAWAVAQSLARAMLPATPESGAAVATVVQRVVRAFPDDVIPPVVLALALTHVDQEDEAIHLLETAIEWFPEDPSPRMALALVYQRAQRLSDVLATLQDAIDAGAVSPSLYRLYADFVIGLHRGALMLPRFVFIEPIDQLPVRLLEEAEMAYQAVLEGDPTNLEALHQRVQLLSELQDEAIWSEFERLVREDTSGTHVRSVVDTFELMPDIGPGLTILEAAVERMPERADLRVSYAVALLVEEELEEASRQLEAARSLTSDSALLADIERLSLAANDPDFDTRIGDIIDTLSSGRDVPLDDIDFLEEAVEAAPSFAQGYLLLARAYQSRDEHGAALETLLDAEKAVLDEPEIITALAQILWDADEHDLAFQYLNKGLARAPNNVNLLALIGRYLFEDEQYEEARGFLNRADSLNPMNPLLRQVKRYIAQALG